MHRFNNVTRTGSPRRFACLSLLWLGLLPASACGAGGSVHTTPTHTPTPHSSGHGVLYAFGTNLGANGPTSTDVYALGIGDGKQVWHTQVSGGGGGAALGGGTLYLGTYQSAGQSSPPTGTLQAFNASTGAPLWHVAPSSGVEVPIAASSTAVFAFSITFNSAQTVPTVALTALRASDGTTLWSADLGQTPGGPLSGIAFSDSALYLVTMSPPASGNAGPGQAMLNAVDTTSGKSLWRDPLPGPLNAGLVLSGGVLYLAVQNLTQGGTSAILAVQASDGKTLWSKAPPAAAAVGGFAITSQTVCYSYGLLDGPGGGIIALHPADGSQRWQANIQSGGPAPIAADLSAVYALESTKSAAPTLATTFNAFDASTGTAVLSKALPSLPIQEGFQAGTPLQMSNGVLYVAGSGVALPVSTATQQPPIVSIVLALNTHDGSVVWQHQFNGSAQPNFIVAP